MTSPESPSDGRSTPFSPLVPGRSGRPTYSLEALRERVERQFQRRPPAGTTSWTI